MWSITNVRFGHILNEDHISDLMSPRVGCCFCEMFSIVDPSYLWGWSSAGFTLKFGRLTCIIKEKIINVGQGIHYYKTNSSYNDFWKYFKQ